MSKPFKIAQPPSVNKNETKPVAAPPAGKGIVNSRETGDPLPNTSTDTPDHPPIIPWPPAEQSSKVEGGGGAGDKHMPFKKMT